MSEAPPLLARRLVRTAWKACLATLDRDSGVPYASLVAVAADSAGCPLLLLSDLALHTGNLKADARISLLFDATGPGPAALTGPRVTLLGHAAASADPAADGRRYVARHPGAADYIGFGDFNLYRLVPTGAHMVAGFGHIARLTAGDLTTPIAGTAALLTAEADIIAHMNADHDDALEAMAVVLAGMAKGRWLMLGCDPLGIDLACGTAAVRLDFPQLVSTPTEARSALVAMARAARAGAGGP